MKKNLIKKWSIPFFSLVLFSLFYLIEKGEFSGDRSAFFADKIAKTLEKKEQDYVKIYKNDTLLNRFATNVFTEELINNMRDMRVIALVYRNKKLVSWTSTAVDNSISQYVDSAGQRVVETKRGWYFTESKNVGSYQYLLAYPLYRSYLVDNPLLDEGFNYDLEIEGKAALSNQPKEGYIKVNYPDLQTPLYIQFDHDINKNRSMLSVVFFFAALLLLLAFISNIYEHYYGKGRFITAWMLLLLSLVAMRAIMQFFHIPAFLYDLPLFGPDIYASSIILPSLGDLFLNTLVLFVMVFSAYKYVITAPSTRNSLRQRFLGKNYIQVIFLLLLLVVTILILDTLQSLINDSRISFDVTNILKSNLYSVIGLVIAAMLLFTHFLMVNTFVSFYEKSFVIMKQLIPRFLLCLVLYIAFAWPTHNLKWLVLMQSVSYLIAIYITYQLVAKQNYFQKTIALIIVIAIFASSLFYRAVHDKELEFRKMIANKITNSKDLTAESVFLEIENKLENDRFIVDYFSNPLLLKSQLEKRIKQLYFTGYLSRYDVDILDYDTLGYSFRELNYFGYDFLNNLYNTQTQSTLSNHFFYINDPAQRFGYIAKFEICNSTGSLGRLFILLRPKFVQDEKIFGELLSRPANKEEQIDNSIYSYAIYQDGQLMNQSGTYPYSTVFDFKTSPTDELVMKKDGFSHFVRFEAGNVVTVVSRKKDSFLQPLTVFSFLFLAFCLFALLVFLINGLIIYTRVFLAGISNKKRQLVGVYNWIGKLLPYRKFRGLYFSTRIQVAMITIVLLALLLTGYFTIEYINFKYTQRQDEKLTNKVKSILSAIENENRFEEKLAYPDEVSAYLNQLADFYNTDISLFDLDGKLLASTQNRIYQSGLMLDRINPVAYAQLAVNRKSQYNQRERIGKLEYISSYVPLFDSRHELLAYLSVPFFSNEEELRNELSSFLVNFINIYVFFFILVGLTAYIISQRLTAPLTLIQEKLANTSLGNKNELLEWKQNDEIGQLVKQYNKMVLQIEAGALGLAKTEREGAWKEMAKQIAHEIKNPLTPMKLSVQYLQRAWLNGSDNIDETFKRVTSVLIEQIDSLSLLATEFSSFAKMPAARIEAFELTEVINSIVELYYDAENIRITYRASTRQLTVKADKNQVSRVFNNVIKNAIQAIAEGQIGEVNISVQKEGVFAKVMISDNGCGIPPEEADKVFVPSFSTKNSGMGLGLAISRQIIETAGGEIYFESAEGQGTTFFITIPLHEDEEKA